MELQHDDVFTIPEYCAVEKVSRAKVYDEWKRGIGVEFFRRGTKILISNEARIRHRQRLEREAREERAHPIEPEVDAESQNVAA